MKKPNILIICVDHWPGRLIGAAGHKYIMTPTLDSLAESGVHFTRAYSSTPTCIPARRELMTGVSARTHGDRSFKETLPMPEDLHTMPELFCREGYQTYAAGKLHVYPQRARIGFENVLLHEEGRHHLDNFKDDYELYLERRGLSGRELTHGMGNNQYSTRPWHLEEEDHPTNWTTREMCRQIKRRDPTRPGFWFCSYAAPHPPLTPPAEYFNLYTEREIDKPFMGTWAEDFGLLPYALKYHRKKFPELDLNETDLARKAFYAQCTYIDHQIRLLIGTLREECLLDDTILVFTGDHGDMLGNHNLWAKPPMFEYSVNIPLLISVPPGIVPEEKACGTREDFAALRDIMPTLLDLCGVAVPPQVEGISLYSGSPRSSIYCEHFENELAMRMIRKSDYKLIWYPAGNRFQLFNLSEDPCELEDLSEDKSFSGIMEDLKSTFIDNLYGSDVDWVEQGKIIGFPDKPFRKNPEMRKTARGLLAQRGWR